MTLEEMRERLKTVKIPRPPCLPQGKKVILFRLPSEEKTRGGLYIPEEHANPHQFAVLIAAGLAARDVMRDHLMEIGDIVMLPAFVTDTPEVERREREKGVHVVRLNVEDLLGSVDALDRFENEYRVAYDEENGEHFYEKRDADHTRARNKRKAA